MREEKLKSPALYGVCGGIEVNYQKCYENAFYQHNKCKQEFMI